MQIMYRGLSPLEAGIMTIPLVLYQGSQVILGQITAAVMKNYIAREKLKEFKLKEVEEKENIVQDSQGEVKEEVKAGSGEGIVAKDVQVKSKLAV